MNTSITLESRWSWGARSLYYSQLWYYGLLAAGSISNILYYCTVPLVGIGVLAGTTLPQRRALTVLLTLWFVNQLLGFTVRGYPYTISTFAWGGVMLLGAILAVLLASLRPVFRHDQLRHGLWLTLSLLLGFSIYELVIWLGGLALGGVHGFTIPILAEVLLGNALWGGGLAAVHWGLVQHWMRWQDAPSD